MRALLVVLGGLALLGTGATVASSAPRKAVSLRVTVHDGHGGTRHAKLSCHDSAHARGFNRADGCGIDDWENAKDLLGGVPR
jgi:hypothetical protein